MSNLTSLKTLLSLENFESVWADLSADARAAIKADLQAALRAAGKDQNDGRLTSADVDYLIFADEAPEEHAMGQQRKAAFEE